MSDHLNSLAAVSEERISIIRFAPPRALAPYVMQLYFFRFNDTLWADKQPASLSHLIFYLHGKGSIRFCTGEEHAVFPASLYGPCSSALEFSFTGPFVDFGVALTAAGFVALSGQSAKDCADTVMDAGNCLGREIDALTEQLREMAPPGSNPPIEEMARLVSDFLLTQITPIPDLHLKLIDTVNKWLHSSLSPDVDELFALLAFSRSTATRLISRYFGTTPKALMRKYRALRAAKILVDPATSHLKKAEVESHFYDQPHMIREIRHFTGRTPGMLDDTDTGIFRLWLGKGDYRDWNAEGS